MIIKRGCDVSPQIDFGDSFADDAAPLISIKPLIDMRQEVRCVVTPCADLPPHYVPLTETVTP